MRKYMLRHSVGLDKKIEEGAVLHWRQPTDRSDDAAERKNASEVKLVKGEKVIDDLKNL